MRNWITMGHLQTKPSWKDRRRWMTRPRSTPCGESQQDRLEFDSYLITCEQEIIASMISTQPGITAANLVEEYTMGILPSGSDPWTRSETTGGDNRMSLERFRRTKMVVFDEGSLAYQAARAMEDDHIGSVLVSGPRGLPAL